MKLRKKYKLKKFFLLMISCYLLYQTASYFLTDIKLVNGNQDFIKRLLQDSNYHLLYEKQNKNVVTKIINLINQVDLQEPVTLLENSFVYNETTKPVFTYMNNPIIESPRVYIYSTHQNEGYSGKGLDSYNIQPGVMMASYILQDKLNELGITTIVEQRSVADYLNKNSLDYKDSYQATRHFLKTTLEEYKELDLIIDLHRDALSKDLSTVTINDKKFAKVLFVMNPNYKDNISLVNKLNNSLNKKYPQLGRGIYDKYKDTFNQDLNNRTILLEIGGQYNTIDEVLNTINALVEVIKENI